MTDHDLATLLRDHLAASEPTLPPATARAIALGRRRLLRRRVGGALAGGVAAAALVTTVAVVAPWHGSEAHGVDPATAAALDAYDASRMPQVIDENVRPVLDRTVHDLAPSSVFRAEDGYGQRLTAGHYDLAASMTTDYTAGDDTTVRVYLAHARSEAEGSARSYCAANLESGYQFSCTVARVGGDTVITSVTAVRRAGRRTWAVLTRDEIRTGRITATDPVQEPIDPAQIFFQRNVKVIHSETFVTDVDETVRAPDVDTAGRLWRVPVTALEEIARDPELVIPEPPVDEKGCPVTLDPDVGCTRESGPGDE